MSNNIPFSWENKPGFSKSVPPRTPLSAGKLPPPPCPPEKYRPVSAQDLQIPLPPRAFRHPLRSTSSRRVVRKEDDPFLMAYEECTKSSKKGKVNREEVGFGLKKNSSSSSSSMSFLSCKHSCSVRDDSIVRISQLPFSKSRRERDQQGEKEIRDYWWIHS